MAKEMKELTTKQKIRKNKRLQFACKVGEYAVIPIPFFALMIANRDVWFATPTSGISIGIGGAGCVLTLIASIILVVKESEGKKIANGYLAVLLKWLMALAIIELVERFLSTIAGVMAIATSGIIASFLLDATRLKLKKKCDYDTDTYRTAQKEKDVEKARREISQEEEQPKKIKVRIKK